MSCPYKMAAGEGRTTSRRCKIFWNTSTSPICHPYSGPPYWFGSWLEPGGAQRSYTTGIVLHKHAVLSHFTLSDFLENIDYKLPNKISLSNKLKNYRCIYGMNIWNASQGNLKSNFISFLINGGNDVTRICLETL